MLRNEEWGGGGGYMMWNGLLDLNQPGEQSDKGQGDEIEYFTQNGHPMIRKPTISPQDCLICA